jgi:hypothetical protein
MRKLLTLLLMALIHTACSKQANTFDWKEEIQLHDGRKIIAQRLDVLGGRSEPAQGLAKGAKYYIP